MGNPYIIVNVERATGLVKQTATAVADDEIAAAGFVNRATREVDDPVPAAESDGHRVSQVDYRGAADVIGAFGSSIFSQPVWTRTIDRPSAMVERANTEEAVISGSLSRIRPILITAATTILTLLPLAFSHQGDTVISQTLGIVVIGGMITSTLNSFLVIPIIYQWLHKKQSNKKVISTEEVNSL